RVAHGVVPVAGADAARTPAGLAALAAVRLAAVGPARHLRGLVALAVPRQPEDRLAGAAAVPVRAAAGGVHLHLARRAVDPVGVLPAVAVRVAVHGRVGTDVLERVRLALQLHRGGLPDLHARGGRQHPGVIPDRALADDAGGGRHRDRRAHAAQPAHARRRQPL